MKFNIQSIKIIQMGKLKGKNLKGAGALPSAEGTGTGYGFYMQGDDKIDREYPCEENILYSTFTFSGKEAVAEVNAMFKEKVDAFLSLPR